MLRWVKSGLMALAVLWGSAALGETTRDVAIRSGSPRPTWGCNFLLGALCPGQTFTRGTLATIYDAGGNLTYAPNNLLLQSAAPGTQSITTTAGANYIVYIAGGTGSITLSGAATGTVNAGAYLKVTATTASLTLTVSGSPTNVSVAAVTYETAPRPGDQVVTTSAAYYGPAFDTNPATLAPLGLRIEEGRTNSNPNSAMVGAGVGVAPNLWSLGSSGVGVTESIVGSGIENGINYIDVNVSGTATGTLGGFTILSAGLPGAIPAVNGQTWTASQSTRLLSGSLPGAVSLGIVLANAGNGEFAAYITPLGAGSATLGASRVSYSATLLSPIVASIRQRFLELSIANGTTYNFTLRIGAPGLELNPNIPATVASATYNRSLTAAVTNANGSGYGGSATGLATYNGSDCVTPPVLNMAQAGGTLTVSSVATAGVCPSTQALTGANWTMSGGITSGSGFTITPTLTALGSGYVGSSGTMTYSGAGCAINPVYTVTASGGLITGVTSVANAGSCTAATGLPAANSTSWTPGGGLSAGSGASFTPTPVNNAAQAFATSPILTYGTALSRGLDVSTAPLPNCPNPSLYVQATPASPAANPNNQVAASVSDGTGNNRNDLIRVGSTGYVFANNVVAGVGYGVVAPVAWAQSALGKATSSVTPSLVSVKFNSANLTTAASAGVTVPQNLLNIGSRVGPAGPWNGTIQRVAVSCGHSLLNN